MLQAQVSNRECQLLYGLVPSSNLAQIGNTSLVSRDLDLTKCKGTEKIGSLNRGFVRSRFFLSTFYCDLISLGSRISFVIPRTPLLAEASSKKEIDLHDYLATWAGHPFKKPKFYFQYFTT